MLGTILLAFAFVFACFASFGVGSFGRVQTFPLALALLILALLLGRLPGLL